MSQVQLAPQPWTPKPGAPVLSLDHLSVTFVKKGGFGSRGKSVVRAVDDVSFELRDSEVLSLVGESGSGKTTVARCIVGLVPPTLGKVYYRGVDLEEIRRKDIRAYRREVQVIYQDPFESLNPRLDVFTQVSLPLRRLVGISSHEELVDRVSKVLLEVGLDPGSSIEKLPHQLSGGERQRVNIARALAPGPKLLIADEPITMLDASQRVNILALLMELKRKLNLTVLMITHDLASAKVTSDRTAVMYLGRLAEFGPTSTVLSKPIHPYTELVLKSTPNIKGGLADEEPVEKQEGQQTTAKGCNFAPRCKYATDVCSNVNPPLEQKLPSHYAACHNPLNTARTS